MILRFISLLVLSTAVSQGQLQPQGLTLSGSLPPYITNTLALTYDDGPELAGYTRDHAKFLHDYRPSGSLRQSGIEAVFFVNGCRMVSSTDPNRQISPYTGNCFGWGLVPEDQLSELVALGHVLGQHTYDHVDLTNTKLTIGDLVSQLVDMQAVLNRHQNVPWTLMRAPFLAWTPQLATVLNSLPQVQALKLIGYFACDFCGNGRMADGKIVRGDWDCLQRYSPQACAYPYVQAILSSPNHSGIILIHDRQQFISPSDKPQQLVAEILRQLPPGQGPNEYRYVRLDKLLQELQQGNLDRLPHRAPR